MPSSTMRVQDEYPLPEDVLLPAKLVQVEERVYEFVYKAHHRRVQDNSVSVGDKGEVRKWTWRFQIVDGDYAGLNAWGETESYLSSHPDNKVRQWGEALRGSPFQVGETLQTDDLLGLSCMITVRHDEPRPRRDGAGNFYPCPVDSVFPPSVADDLPPF